ncbi:MAG: saccharopine dehydrogenase NADP-binding domain-containing protein [Bacteroidales bacterium]|nr:saccharopine dehydrogenase NADP-binding domain-containing protein [Bacteroidales bacterium]
MVPDIKILIIGGYGNVGSKIVSILDSMQLFSITIAGRNLDKAHKLAKQYSKNVHSCKFDAQEFLQKKLYIKNNDIIISCIDLSDDKLAKFILENGKIYIDLTASYEYIQKVEQINDIALINKGLAVLSVGLVPGLSNLMIKHLQQISKRLNHFEKAEIFVQLGLGDTNGKAAVQWILNNVNKEYIVKNKNQDFSYKPLTKGKYEEIFGKRVLFYPFNFSDQHVVCNTLNINRVVSYLGFNSNLISILFSFLKKIGFFNLLKIKSVNNLLLKAFTKIRIGNDLFSLNTKLYTTDEKVYSLSVLGKEEAVTTARIVCNLIRWIHFSYNSLPVGVNHIEQLFSYEEAMKDLNFKIQLQIEG